MNNRSEGPRHHPHVFGEPAEKSFLKKIRPYIAIHTDNEMSIVATDTRETPILINTQYSGNSTVMLYRNNETEGEGERTTKYVYDYSRQFLLAKEALRRSGYHEESEEILRTKADIAFRKKLKKSAPRHHTVDII